MNLINKELCEVLRFALIGLSYIDKLAGLVQTIETKSKVEGSNEIIRFPAADMVPGVDLGQWQYADLVPNSNKKSIIYFEDRGLRFLENTSRGLRFEAKLRVVGWLNEKFPLGADAVLVRELLLRFLNLNRKNSGIFQQFEVKPESVLGVEDNIFAKYTYDQTIRQFLILPYHALAIDLTINFILGKNCELVGRQFDDSFDLAFL